MESTEAEALQLEIMGLLCTLPVDSLIGLCDFLTIAGLKFEHVTGKNRASLILMISNHLQSEELQNLEDMGMAQLLCFKDKITELQNETTAGQVKELQATQNEEQNKPDETEDSTSTDNRPQSCLPLQIKSTDENEHKFQATIPTLRMTTSGSAPGPTPPLWHKEFKIAGQIGEPGQKDRLTFSSLARQIEHGLLKGFPETEIVDAVIRAIVPGMQLRSYLEGKSDLALPTLRRILRCHYQEKSATELYKQLSSEAQGIKETPQNFLIRTLDLRQKILFASQESESGLRYDPVLVQNMFLHTVMTGLQNDNIKRDLQPFLEQAGVSDELLFEKLNIACAYESERQEKKKMNTPQRSVTVHSAQSDHATVEKKEKINHWLQNEEIGTVQREFFKRARVTPAGQGVTTLSAVPQLCAYCGVGGIKVPLKVARSQRKGSRQNSDTELNSQQEDDSDDDSEDEWFYYPCPEPLQHTSPMDEIDHTDQSAATEPTAAKDRQGEEQEKVLQPEEYQELTDVLERDGAPEQLENCEEDPPLLPMSPPSCESHSGNKQLVTAWDFQSGPHMYLTLYTILDPLN
ncbi:uncharacterized protein LOC106526962 [Austrofundulus limnaeus]|uniref:Uncharacterized protein LOC106526962 n=1 Tax=Austrofundulus limnaeus TaxID=52670 RepID=A0A2I4CAZ3_AUSLI|nr:PREDICTED: uncharacterized protein LOC106526962 [Austrofundulus limnaeus]